MTRSPIEILIDRACGISDPPKVDLLTLRCPTCGKERHDTREWYDPPAAAVMLFPCQQCRTADAEVRWVDASGREVT
jgi:hypothetical protein